MGSDNAAREGEQGLPLELFRQLVHDLRSPLVAAQGFLSLLERAPTGPDAERYMASLKESISDMKAAIEQSQARCGELEQK